MNPGKENVHERTFLNKSQKTIMKLLHANPISILSKAVNVQTAVCIVPRTSAHRSEQQMSVYPWTLDNIVIWLFVM